MAWESASFETIEETGAGDGINSSIFELEPGSSAVIEVLRIDTTPTATEGWRASILMSLDNTNLADVLTPFRLFGPVVRRVIFSVDSIGVRYFAVRVQNGFGPGGGGTEIVEAEIRVMKDGISL